MYPIEDRDERLDNGRSVHGAIQVLENRELQCLCVFLLVATAPESRPTWKAKTEAPGGGGRTRARGGCVKGRKERKGRFM